jgi:MFS family permease
MVQGVLAGIGIGLTYAPSLAVISQHFSKRRTLAMSLVTSGTSLGAVIHPIMLNHLFNGHVGFSRGVLVSAGFVSTLLLVAHLSIRTIALPAPSANYRAVARKCSRDVLFILMTLAYVVFGMRRLED